MKKPILTFEQRKNLDAPALKFKIEWMRLKRELEKSTFGYFIKRSVDFLQSILDFSASAKVTNEKNNLLD